MKKFASLTILMVALLGATVTSCQTGSSVSSSSSAEDEDVTVTFWHTMGHANSALVDKLISKFEEDHPHVTISSVQASGGYDDLEAQLLQAIPAGTTPTMAFCYPDHVAKYLSYSGTVVDLTSYMNDPEIGFQVSDGSHTDNSSNVLSGKDDYVKAFWEEGSNYPTSGVYSVPFAKSTEALFYNKDEFDKNGWQVPTTWDQMWSLCQTIRDANPEMDEDQKHYKVYPLGYDSDANMYITLSQQKNIPFTSSTGEHYLFNNSEAKSMVTDLKTKYDNGLFVTKGTSGNSTYTSTKFTAGEILMSIGSTGGTAYNSTNNFTVGVAVPPSVDADSPAVISQGPSICFFSRATTAQKRAAWEFYRFISTADNSCYYSVSTGYQPVRISSYQTPIYESFINATGADRGLFNEVGAVTSTMQDSYFNSPVFDGSATARGEIGNLMGSVLLGTKTVDAAFNDAMSNCLTNS